MDDAPGADEEVDGTAYGYTLAAQEPVILRCLNGHFPATQFDHVKTTQSSRNQSCHALSRDAAQDFPDGAGAPADAIHPPVNFHAFAACTGGGFFRDDRAIPADMKAVLLLLRHDLKASRQALLELRRRLHKLDDSRGCA